jgi:threonine dehydratase
VPEPPISHAYIRTYQRSCRPDCRACHRTPVVTSRSFNELTGREVFFKCENLQRAGAFKARGATNKIQSLNEDEKQRGVIAVSSGNHAQAVALAAGEAGVRAVVCVPDDARK